MRKAESAQQTYQNDRQNAEGASRCAENGIEWRQRELELESSRLKAA